MPSERHYIDFSIKFILTQAFLVCLMIKCNIIEADSAISAAVIKHALFTYSGDSLIPGKLCGTFCFSTFVINYIRNMT